MLSGDRAGHAGGVLGQHAGGGADLAGGAVAALEAVVADERPRQLAGDPLDRGDLAPGVLHGQGQAGVDPLAVGEHRARPAGALVAALLRAGQAEVLAQRVEQADLRREPERHGLAVDPQLELDGVRLFPRHRAGSFVWSLSMWSSDGCAGGGPCRRCWSTRARAVRAARSSVTDRGSRWPPRLPCCRKSARPWAAEATRTSRSKAASSPAARPATGSRTQMSSWAAAASSGWRVLSRPALKAISNSARSSPAKRTYAAATAASCSRGSSLAARAAAQRRRCSAKLRAASAASSASRSAKCLYGAATLTPARRQAPAGVKPCGPPSATSARAASSRASRRRPWCCPVVRRLMITRPRLTTFTCEEPEDRQSDAWHGRNEEPEDRRSGDPGVVEAGGRVADRRHESFVGGELRVERVQGAVHAVGQRPGRERGQLGRARVADRGAVAA